MCGGKRYSKLGIVFELGSGGCGEVQKFSDIIRAKENRNGIKLTKQNSARISQGRVPVQVLLLVG